MPGYQAIGESNITIYSGGGNVSNKRKAITRTATKVIINMDIAVEALNKTQIKNLHEVMDRLRIWDEKYKAKYWRENQ